jgi:PAS domain S-box-containing protein
MFTGTAEVGPRVKWGVRDVSGQLSGETVQALRRKVRALVKRISELEETNRRLELTEREFRQLADNVPAYFAYVGADQRYRYVNKRYEEKYKVPRSDIVGKRVRALMGKEDYESVRHYIERALRCERVGYNVVRLSPAGGKRYYDVTLIPDCPDDGVCEDGKAEGYFALVVDTTDRREVEERLSSVVTELDRKQIAIHEVIDLAGAEIAKMKADVTANVKTAILPILARLQLQGAPQKYIDLIKAELDELTSSFGARVSEPALRLSAREIEICDMIRDGMTSKEIAALLRLSVQTVGKHRRNIRKKLGISGIDINLVTYLRHM